MQPITLRNWKLNPISGRYESGYNPLYPVAGQVVITGSGFGTKPTQSPSVFSDFTSGSVGQLVKDFDSEWVGFNSSIGAVISDLDARFSGHKAAYSDPDRGGDFFTNHHSFPQTETVFISFWARVHSYRGLSNIGGVPKFARVNSSVSAGGSGVYSGVGTTNLGGSIPPSWYYSWTGSGSDTGNQVYLDGDHFPINAWRRIEYEIKLNDIDVANGFQRVYIHGYGEEVLSSCMQRKTGFALSDYLLDSTLLGVECPNQWRYYKPNILQANTDYTITVSGVQYTYSKPTTPTIVEILESLRDSVIAGGHTARIWNDEEINVNGANSPTYSSNFSLMPAYGMSQADTFVDIDPEFKRFYIGLSSVWDECAENANPLLYQFWSDTEVFGDMPPMPPSEEFYVFKQLSPLSTPTLVGQLSKGVDGIWRVSE